MNLKKWFLISAVAVVTSACSSKSGTEKVSVKAISRANNYPEISLTVNIREEESGKGVYGKERSDFQILENGVRQSIASFSRKGEGRVEPIDIVFVFDQTGSMSDEISAVRDNSLMFADYLKSSNMDYRLALITFSDEMEKEYGFTSDIEEFKTRISSVRANGGGDTPENALDALSRAMSLEFRKNAAVVFILITDAPYHQGNKVTKQFMLPLAKKIKLEGIRIFPITVDLEQYVWMARETEGNYFDIRQDFTSVIEQLAVELTAQYTISYFPVISAFDNSRRNVEIVVSETDTAKTSYKSAADIVVSSQLMEKNRPSDAYRPANMTDGKKETAWSEGDPGNGIGQWVKFGLDKSKRLKTVRIISGYAKTDAIFRANNRIKQLRMTFSNGKSQVAVLEDTPEYQRVLIDSDSPATFVKFEILEVYKGSKYSDACISEIDFEYKE